MNKFNPLLSEPWSNFKGHIYTIRNGIQADIWPGDFVVLSSGVRLDYSGKDVEAWNEFIKSSEASNMISNNGFSVLYYLITIDKLPKSNRPKCTCGVTITLGKDDHIDYHSDYCDLKEKRNAI